MRNLKQGPMAIALDDWKRSQAVEQVRALLAALSTSLFLGAAVAAPPAEARSVTYNLDIPSQSLNDALQALALASRHKLLYSSELVDGKTSRRVKGEFTTEEAVKALISGTDLIYEVTTDGLVLIRAAAAVMPAGNVTGHSGSGTGVLNGEQLYAQAETDKNPENKTPSETSPSASSREYGEAKIEEIIVTAQKRKQSLQEVPISISVLSGRDLDSSSLSDVRDALNSVPSLDFSQTGGFTGGSMISVRGVANGTYREGGASTVAYYMDGTPYGLVRSAVVPLDADPYDLERIEVLRGPQGTLYGANSLNGVIRVLTHDANTKAFELKARTFLSNTHDGSENYGGNLAVNVPLIQDKLAIRGVMGYRRDAGWIESPIENNVNSSKLQSYRLKVRAEPTETLTIDLSAWHSKSNLGAPSLANDDNRITTDKDESSTTEYDVFGAEIIKDFGAFSVSSMTSYIDSRLSGRFDGTAAGANLILVTSLPSKIFTEELNVVSRHAGPWRWSAGAFYRDAKDETFQLRDWLPPLEQFFGDITVNNDYRDTSKSFAVYGELGRRLFNDKLEISAGLRYFDDKQTLQILSPYLAALPLTPFRSSAEATTPRVVLTWSPKTASNFYASYSQGFRSGVIQAPNIQERAPHFPPARPDKLHNYEGGAKGSLLDGRLGYEGAVYYIDWQDVQQPLNVYIIPGSLTATAVVNGASASGLGAEFALSARPTERLELGTRFSWNDLTFDNTVAEASGRVLFPKGGRLSVSPEYTAAAFASYSFPLGGDGFKGAFAISGSYKSAQTWYLLSPASVYVPTLGDKRFDGGSASFSIAARSRWTARLFADNITNERSSQEAIGLNASAASREWRERPRPRTIGAQLEYRFE